MINGDAPQIKVKALEALLVETECREGGGKYNRQGQISRAENRKGEVKSLPLFFIQQVDVCYLKSIWVA